MNPAVNKEMEEEIIYNRWKEAHLQGTTDYGRYLAANGQTFLVIGGYLLNP